jgi:hypothetical protein
MDGERYSRGARMQMDRRIEMARGHVTVDLEALRRELRRAKKEERPERLPSLREAVGVLFQEINALRHAKWSDAQIAEWLRKRGLEISPGTLAQYIRVARRTMADTGGEHQPKHAPNAIPNEEPSIVGARHAARGVRKAEPEGDQATNASKESTAAKPARPSEPTTTRMPNAATAIPKRRVNDDA